MKALFRIVRSAGRHRLFWPLAGALTLLLSLWLYFSQGGLTGLAREAMNISLEVFGETVYRRYFRFLVQLISPFLFLLASLFCWWMTIRNWATYYLNRKLVMSYLFFAFIPLLSTIIIFVLGARTLFGITAAHGVEKGMENLSERLNSYTEIIQAEMINTIFHPTNSSQMIWSNRESIEKLLTNNPFKDFSGNAMPGFSTHAFYQAIAPNQPWMNLNTNIKAQDGRLRFPPLIHPGTELFNAIQPQWIPDRLYSGMTQIQDALFFMSYRLYETQSFRIVILSAVPVDSFFLNQLQERLSVNLTLEGIDESWRIIPDRIPGKWYVRLFLRPLRSIWNVEICNWDTGRHRLGAQMVFDVAPHLFSAGIQTPDGFLGSKQIQIQTAFIIFIIGILILGQLFALVFGFVLIGYITRSLDILATGNDIVAQGQLSYRLPKMGNDQLGAMAKSFNAMVSNIQNLLEQSKEKEKLEEELRIARDIQMSLLPSLEGQRLGSHLDAVCIPAKEVGGDFFEILEPGHGRSGVLVADVSGKGTSAAFYMAEMKGILLALKPLWDRPVDLIVEMNGLLHTELKSHVFISAIYALLDPQQESVEIVRAGHCPAIVVRKEAKPETIQPQGMALGLTQDVQFSKVLESTTIPLHPGEKLILFTDGLDEMISGEELYGMNRILENAYAHRHNSATALKEAILADVNDFIQSGEQSDDLTLVVIEMPEA